MAIRFDHRLFQGRREDDISRGCQVNFIDKIGVTPKNWAWFVIAQPAIFNTLLVLPTAC